MARNIFYRFFRAVAIGALAGGGVLLLLTIPIGIGIGINGDPASGLLIAILPLLVSGGGSFAGMLLIGLPATVILAEYPPEQAVHYGQLGMIAGLLAPALVILVIGEGDFTFLATGGTFFGLFGAIAGFAAGLSWGGWRESLAAPEPHPAPTNPIHELLF